MVVLKKLFRKTKKFEFKENLFYFKKYRNVYCIIKVIVYIIIKNKKII